MAYRSVIETDVGSVHIVCTDRSDGDFNVANPASDIDDRRSALVDRPWTWLRQVHSADVVSVTRPGEFSGHEADGLVTRVPGCPLSVTTADCSPVVLVANNGVSVVHAGWRGALTGIIDEAATRLLSNGSTPVAAFVGPTISSAKYEFGLAELTPFVDRFGADVVGETTDGSPALDMAKVVELACARFGFRASPPLACTSDQNRFSHRIRKESERQATLAWIDG